MLNQLTKSTRAMALSLTLLAPQTGMAHAPPVGPHGGAQTNAGPWHVEVVIGERDVTVWVTDHAGRLPHGADAMTGTARLADENQGMALVPLVVRSPGMMGGVADRALRRAPVGTVDLRTAAGLSVRATFR
jgi:hypothetical protein